MYLIIVGAGQIGTPLVDLATGSGDDVVVIEKDEAKADAIAADHDCMVMHADATVKETLEEAGAERADAIISTTDKDATNIMVCLLADELDIPSILSVVHDQEHEPLYRKIGVQTMENPQRLIAQYLYRGVKRPAIVDFMRIGDTAEVFEVTVTRDAPIAGKTLQQATSSGLIPDDALVVAIERDDGEPPITPRGDVEIKAGDMVTLYSGSGATPDLTDVFGHTEDRTAG